MAFVFWTRPLNCKTLTNILQEKKEIFLSYFECPSRSLANICSLTLLAFFDSFLRIAEQTNPVTTKTLNTLIHVKHQYNQTKNVNKTIMDTNYITFHKYYKINTHWNHCQPPLCVDWQCFSQFHVLHVPSQNRHYYFMILNILNFNNA